MSDFNIANSSFPQHAARNTVQTMFQRLALLVRLERHILGIIASYAIAVGLPMLCVPIAVRC